MFVSLSIVIFTCIIYSVLTYLTYKKHIKNIEEFQKELNKIGKDIDELGKEISKLEKQFEDDGK